jgi:hypothetical protein
MSKHGMRRRGRATPLTWQQLARATGLPRKTLDALPGKPPPPTRPRTLADYARLAAGAAPPRPRKPAQRMPAPLERKGARLVMIRQEPAAADRETHSQTSTPSAT